MSDPKELGDLAAVVIAADRSADIPALRAIIAAGWVSPEEHAEYVAMEGRFSELLCDLTDGLLSKTNYDVREMVSQVEETFQKYADEDINDARIEAWDACVDAASLCECALGPHIEHPANPYRST